MKQFLFLSVLFCLFSLFSTAQTLSVTGLGGYVFQDKVSFSDTYGYINESGFWGASVEGINREGHAIELLFRQQSTHTPLYYYTFPYTQVNENKDKTTVSYLVVNGLHYFIRPGTAVQPYGGLGIGMAFIDNQSYSTQTKFAWDAKLGAKLKASSRVGIKLEAQLFSIAQASSGGFYVSSGGSGVAVSSYSTIYQFGFSGGLCFDFAGRGKR